MQPPFTFTQPVRPGELAKLFPPISPIMAGQIWRHYTNQSPSESQVAWMMKNVNDPWLSNGVAAISAPQAGKKTLFLYSNCNAWPLIKYWTEFSRHAHILRSYNIVWFQNYRVKDDSDGLRIGAALNPDYSDLFTGALHGAAAIMSHPGYHDTPFSPRRKLAASNAAQERRYNFHSPSFSALWPICYFGDEHIKARLLGGEDANLIKMELQNGLLPCNLKRRFEDSVVRLRRKDFYIDTPIADFFVENWRKARMFTSYNHPTFPMNAFQADILEVADMNGGRTELDRAFRFRAGDDYFISLPWYAVPLQPVWPDHEIARAELNMEKSYGIPDGGKFYESEIDRCAEEIRLKRIKEQTPEQFKLPNV